MKNTFKKFIALTMVASMVFSVPVMAGTCNADKGGSDYFDFEIETEPEYDRTETTIYTIDLTNTIKEEAVRYVAKVQGTKTWEDNDNALGKRPESVTIHLYADNVDTGKKTTISEATNWEYSFSNLKLTDENGKTITYTIKEDVPAGYTVKYSEISISHEDEISFSEDDNFIGYVEVE